jgi:uncharacterized protein involved in copper resistance
MGRIFPMVLTGALAASFSHLALSQPAQAAEPGDRQIRPQESVQDYAKRTDPRADRRAERGQREREDRAASRATTPGPHPGTTGPTTQSSGSGSTAPGSPLGR